MEYFYYFGSLITNAAKCIGEIKCRIVMATAAFNKKKNLFSSKLHLNLKKKLVEYQIWNLAF